VPILPGKKVADDQHRWGNRIQPGIRRIQYFLLKSRTKNEGTIPGA
jgi:hypothetical protein